MNRRVAVVGAGVAGCAAAYGLAGADAAVTVFERRAEPGGRAATRSRGEFVYDVGANYLTDGDDRVTELVTGELAAGLVTVDGPVWTVDADGEISPGDGRHERTWTYREGLAALGDRLLDRAASSGADLRTVYGAAVTRLERAEGGWALETTGGPGSAGSGSPLATSEPFDAVVLTPPAPAVADLLAASPDATDLPPVARLRRAAGAVDYRPVTSVACGYDRRLEWPYYALVDVSKRRDLGWVAREECKPGHVPSGRSLVVVQASPEWSRTRARQPEEELAPAAASQLATLVDDDRLASPAWTDVVRWRHALPESGVPAPVIEDAAAEGLLAAGDWVAGRGRLHAALASGLAVADRLGGR